MPTEQKTIRKLRAILSADVKGYSLLMADNELATIATLKSYRQKMTFLIQQHQGRVVDSPGDNILAEFASAVDAVKCAVKIQEELKERNAELSEGRKMQFRIGINIGDVVQDADRIYGDGVNVAARIEGLADSIEITDLVNNAGFGLNGNFIDFSTDQQMELIQLNITSLTMLCKLFSTDMAKRRSGRILNVASIAGFQAGGPLMSTYYASKAYVILFSEGLNDELARNGVQVSVLCPGPTQTEFGNRAQMNNAKILNVPWLMNSTEVAKIAYSGLIKGKKIIIPGLMNKISAFSTRFTPRSLSTLICRYLNQ